MWSNSQKIWLINQSVIQNEKIKISSINAKYGSKKRGKEQMGKIDLNKQYSIDMNLMKSILRLNVNDLSTSIKGERLTHWIKRQDLFVLSEKRIFNTKKQVKSKFWKNRQTSQGIIGKLEFCKYQTRQTSKQGIL